MFFRDIPWQKIRPLRGWVLAKADPRAKKLPGGLVLPEGLTGLEKVSVEPATVLRVGSDIEKDTGGVTLRPGDRFAFRGFIKDLTWYMLSPAEDGTTVFLIRATDILAVLGPGVEVGALSREGVPSTVDASCDPWDPTVAIDAATTAQLGSEGKKILIWDHDLGSFLGRVSEANLSDGWVEQVLDPDEVSHFEAVSQKYGYVWTGTTEDTGEHPQVRTRRFGRFSAFVAPAE